MAVANHMNADNMPLDDVPNATRVELEKLNGLLVRRLIEKIEDGSASSTDLHTAMNIMRANRITPSEPADNRGFTPGYRLSPEDFPFPVDE